VSIAASGAIADTHASRVVHHAGGSLMLLAASGGTGRHLAASLTHCSGHQAGIGWV
jgi:hypothetical protein